MAHFVPISTYIKKQRTATSILCLPNHIQLPTGVPTCEITQFNIAYLAVHLHVGDHNIPRALLSKTVLNK